MAILLTSVMGVLHVSSAAKFNKQSMKSGTFASHLFYTGSKDTQCGYVFSTLGDRCWRTCNEKQIPVLNVQVSDCTVIKARVATIMKYNI